MNSDEQNVVYPYYPLLLCTHHHKLVHEGGFAIRRDADGAIYFQAPDGRVIPRQGYRLDDMCDDFASDEDASAEAVGAIVVQNASAEARSDVGLLNASAEARVPSAMLRNASAEVREARGAYRVCRPSRAA